MKRLTWFLVSGVGACLVIKVLDWLVAPVFPILVILLLLITVCRVLFGGIRSL